MSIKKLQSQVIVLYQRYYTSIYQHCNTAKRQRVDKKISTEDTEVFIINSSGSSDLCLAFQIGNDFCGLPPRDRININIKTNSNKMLKTIQKKQMHLPQFLKASVGTAVVYVYIQKR